MEIRLTEYEISLIEKLDIEEVIALQLKALSLHDLGEYFPEQSGLSGAGPALCIILNNTNREDADAYVIGLQKEWSAKGYQFYYHSVPGKSGKEYKIIVIKHTDPLIALVYENFRDPQGYFSRHEIYAKIQEWQHRYGATITSLNSNTIDLYFSLPMKKKNTRDNFVEEVYRFCSDVSREEIRKDLADNKLCLWWD